MTRNVALAVWPGGPSPAVWTRNRHLAVLWCVCWSVVLVFDTEFIHQFREVELALVCECAEIF